MKIYCIIPLRSGSKGIKNKNIKLLNDKPLAWYAINSAVKSKIFEKVIVATDSVNYINILKRYSYNKKIIYFKRNKKNSTAKSPTEDVIFEILNSTNFIGKKDLIMLIQATSPLIKQKYIIDARKYFIKKKFDSLFSAFSFQKFIWTNKKNINFPINYDFKKRPMRQSFGQFFVENGAFYLFKVDKFLKLKNRLFNKIGVYIMPKKYSIDIDNLNDFEEAELILKKND
tara:strand:+ start:437 stop:1120 length:684 start_codon:yes stop_codon:yes gene_type:complete